MQFIETEVLERLAILFLKILTTILVLIRYLRPRKIRRQVRVAIRKRRLKKSTNVKAEFFNPT